MVFRMMRGITDAAPQMLHDGGIRRTGLYRAGALVNGGPVNADGVLVMGRTP